MILFGNKTEAVFDWWSVGHVFTFFALTEIFMVGYSLERAVLILIVLAYGWEFTERFLENMDHHKRFFKEKEGWKNRYIGDILCDVIGFLLAWFF